MGLLGRRISLYLIHNRHDEPDVVKEKVKEASEFKILKIKLGRENDRQMIETIRSVTSVPLCVVSIKDGTTSTRRWI